MKWSDLRERVATLVHCEVEYEDALRILADIDAATPEMERQERDAEWARAARAKMLEFERLEKKLGDSRAISGSLSDVVSESLEVEDGS